MSFTEDFLTAVCQHIEDYAEKQFPYSYKTGSDFYTEDEAVLSWEVEPDIDRTIVVRSYVVSDDPSISDSVVGVQFRITGPADMAFVNGAADDLFDLFHGLQTTTMGSVKVVMAERRSGASLGQDGRGRVSRAENYYFTVHRPSKNRT